MNTLMLKDPVDVFDNFFSFPFSKQIRQSFNPEMRISESDKDITILCGLPGINKKDLSVEVKNK